MDNPIQHINELPLQILSKVLLYLKFNDRQSASEVCTTWYTAAQDQRLLESTIVRLAADEHDWAILGGICKRRFPNLKIIFGTGDEAAACISPEITHHSQLVECVKYLNLEGDFNARHVIFCMRHFRALKTLRMGIYSYSDDRFFGKHEVIDRDPLCLALDRLPHLICELQGLDYNEGINSLFACFAGVENVSITSATRSIEHLDPHPPPIDSFMIGALGAFAPRLRELDLRWCNLPHEFVKAVMNIPELKLQTLRFKSCDGEEGASLRALADSPLCPQNLEVLFQHPENFEVRYSAIRYLLAKKPCIDLLDCTGIGYYIDNDLMGNVSDCLERAVREWSGLDEVIIHGSSFVPEMVPDLDFHYEDSHKTLKIELSSDDIPYGTIPTIAKHSPCLKALTLMSTGGRGGIADSPTIPVIVDSFSHLTKLVLFNCDFKVKEVEVVRDIPGPRSIWKLATLETLCLAYSRGLTEDDLVDHHLPNLRRLMLINLSELTDKAVISMVTSNPALRLLDLSGCARVTDRSITAVAGRLKHLRCLLLDDCQRVTYRSAITITEECHMLQMVDATRCEGAFVGALQRQKWRLPYLGSIKTDTDREIRFRNFAHRSALPSSEYLT